MSGKNRVPYRIETRVQFKCSNLRLLQGVADLNMKAEISLNFGVNDRTRTVEVRDVFRVTELDGLLRVRSCRSALMALNCVDPTVLWSSEEFPRFSAS